MASRRTSPFVRRPFPACTGVAEVCAVEQLTPHMTRITLGGSGLDGFFVEQPGEVVTLIWAAPGSDEIVLPEGVWSFPPGIAEVQHARNYTVRTWDADADRLVVDFVVHGDEGRASAWAARARIGDRVGYAGPRTHWTDDDSDADWTLLLADETGLPALAAIVETLPEGHPTLALVEIADAAEQIPLPTAAALAVQWLVRDGEGPGTSRVLERALRALELPAGAGRAWGGGEFAAMKRARRHLRERRGIANDRLTLVGYWACEHAPD